MNRSVTVLLPLYRSLRFIDILSGTIETHLDAGFRVLASDRNGDLECTEALRHRFGNRANFEIDCRNDDAGWTANMNALISACETRYLRIIPHDDTAGADGTALLAEALDENPKSVLAFGQVRARTLEGERLPHLDQLNQELEPGPVGLDAETALGMFWSGRFGGAFKGVVRRVPLTRGAALLIRPTPSLAHSERIWLSAMALLGDFCFLPEIVLDKHYYAGSTHTQWKYDAREHGEAAQTLIEYVEDLLPGDRTRALALIAHNRDRHMAWLNAGRPGAYPGFDASI